MTIHLRVCGICQISFVAAGKVTIASFHSSFQILEDKGQEGPRVLYFIFQTLPRIVIFVASTETRPSREHPVQDYLTFSANVYLSVSVRWPRTHLSTARGVTPNAIELRATNVCHAYVDCVTSVSLSSGSAPSSAATRRSVQTEVIGVKCQRNGRSRKLRLIARSSCVQMFDALTHESIFLYMKLACNMF